MVALWLPGAEKRPEGNGGSMVGGPPRAVWHITYDKLSPGGKMPSFDAIAGYLQRVNYAPHLMWDPWTGKVVQFYPADQSSRALANRAGGVETNRMGKYCIQVEAFFSPGAVVGGKRYDTLAQTPCKGMPEIVAWMRTLGIPDAWPAGMPQWTGNPRSVATWRSRAGHYGHCHVPENDHTDPGPMPKGMFSAPSKEASMALTQADIDAIATAVVDRVYNARGDKVKEALQVAKDGVADMLPRIRALDEDFSPEVLGWLRNIGLSVGATDPGDPVPPA